MSSIEEDNTLQIGPCDETRVLRGPEILRLSAHQIRAFKYEVYVDIHVSTDLTDSGLWRISTRRLSLEAIAAAMPAVAEYLRHDYRLGTPIIEHVVLPPGPVEAYASILEWIKLVVDTGQIEPFPVLAAKPIWNYKGLIEAAQAVRMDYLVNEFNERICQMLHVSRNQEFSLDMEDVETVIELSDHDDDLRGQLIETIKHAKRVGVLNRRFERDYLAFIANYL